MVYYIRWFAFFLRTLALFQGTSSQERVQTVAVRPESAENISESLYHARITSSNPLSSQGTVKVRIRRRQSKPTKWPCPSLLARWDYCDWSSLRLQAGHNSQLSNSSCISWLLSDHHEGLGPYELRHVEKGGKGDRFSCYIAHSTGTFSSTPASLEVASFTGEYKFAFN